MVLIDICKMSPFQGAVEGMAELVNPDWEKLKNYDVNIDYQ